MSRISERHRGQRFRLKKFSDYQKMKGVMFYLNDKGFKNQKDAIEVIMEFVEFAGIELPSKRKVKYACCSIQENFPVFLKWFYERYNVSGRNENSQQKNFQERSTNNDVGERIQI